jgi:hypothetical protein
MCLLCRSVFRAICVLTLLSPLIGRAEAITNESQILLIVGGLGREAKTGQEFSNNIAVLKQLSNYPKKAVPILIGELNPVSIVKLDYATNNPAENAEARHVVWCLRALYYLTGHKILASSSYRLTDSDLDKIRSGLVVKESGKWAFFAEWMSRGTLYFAPLDAQKIIIEEWKNWLKREAATYRFPKTVDFNEWYFGGPDY